MTDDKTLKIRVVYGPLPDGSGFAGASLPLPKDHWCYRRADLNPPAPFRMGTGELRTLLAQQIREVGEWAYLSAGIGQDDHDPDAFLQNLIVGFLGVWTEDGYSHDSIGDCNCETCKKPAP